MLKTALTANLVLAIGLIAAYVLYGLFAGLPIDRYFLGVSGPFRLGRGGGTILPEWTFDGAFAGIILASLIIGPHLGWNMRYHRLLCGVFGSVSLMALLIHLPHRVIFPEDEMVSKVPAGIPWFDYYLALYVWSSYLAYALLGPNKEYTSGVSKLPPERRSKRHG